MDLVRACSNRDLCRVVSARQGANYFIAIVLESELEVIEGHVRFKFSRYFDLNRCDHSSYRADLLYYPLGLNTRSDDLGVQHRVGLPRDGLSHFKGHGVCVQRGLGEAELVVGLQDDNVVSLRQLCCVDHD